jgi:hypothetical protein
VFEDVKVHKCDVGQSLRVPGVLVLVKNDVHIAALIAHYLQKSSYSPHIYDRALHTAVLYTQPRAQ